MNNTGSGSSTITSRRDYLPFGEEIGAGVGLRTTTQKYSQSDNVRRRFAMLERDDVIGLDHTWFRKYENKAGRWTGTDPKGQSMSLSDPQMFNRYTYVANDPINFADPSGLQAFCIAVFLVTRTFDRITMQEVRPATWEYLYSFCFISGRFVKTVLDPAPRPSGNSTKGVTGNDRMKTFEREYDKCIQKRKKERTQIQDNLPAQAVTDAANETLLFGLIAGGKAGWEYGKWATRATPMPGPLLGPPIGAIGVGSTLAGGMFLEETGRNYIKGAIFDVPEALRKHEAEDQKTCEGEAARRVLNL